MTMVTRAYLTTSELHSIVRYSEEDVYSGAVVTYHGSVRKHPYDDSKFLLITSPVENPSHFYEFRIRDVVRTRDYEQLVTEEGDTIHILEVHVRAGSHGIEMIPFEVEPGKGR